MKPVVLLTAHEQRCAFRLRRLSSGNCVAEDQLILLGHLKGYMTSENEDERTVAELKPREMNGRDLRIRRYGSTNC